MRKRCGKHRIDADQKRAFNSTDGVDLRFDCGRGQIAGGPRERQKALRIAIDLRISVCDLDRPKTRCPHRRVWRHHFVPVGKQPDGRVLVRTRATPRLAGRFPPPDQFNHRMRALGHLLMRYAFHEPSDNGFRGRPANGTVAA
jgi:hypothetical protein